MTGRALTAASTSSELYPITAEPDVTRAIMRRARRDRDPLTGKMIIATPLTGAERETINKRLSHLAKGLEPADRGRRRQAVAELLAGWPAGGDDLAAAGVVAEYVKVLDGLPLFAVLRSCNRWARGEVQPDEVGEKRLSRSFPPSAAHVRIVAEAAARPHWDEASVGSLLLSAVTARAEITDEERERAKPKIRAMNESFQRTVSDGSAAEAAARQAALAAADEKRRDRDRAARIAEYEQNGLEPVFADADCKIVVSLPMMLQNGWRIETAGGESVLVKPSEVES